MSLHPSLSPQDAVSAWAQRFDDVDGSAATCELLTVFIEACGCATTVTQEMLDAPESHMKSLIDSIPEVG